MSKEITHLLFLDIENTAKHPVNSGLNAIVEIACASLRLEDLQIEKQWQTLIRPPRIGDWGSEQVLYPKDLDQCRRWDLGDFHIKGGHFDGVDWDQAIPLHDALCVLVNDYLPGATIAGQNPNFDLWHIRRDCSALRISLPETEYHMIDICSPALFLKMAGEVPGVSLKHTRLWAMSRLENGQPTDSDLVQGHRAMSDVLDSINVFRALWGVFSLGIEASRMGIR